MSSYSRRDHRVGQSVRLWRGLLMSQVFLLPWLLLWCHEQALVATVKGNSWKPTLPFLGPPSRLAKPSPDVARVQRGLAGLSIAPPSIGRSLQATESVAPLPRFDGSVIAGLRAGVSPSPWSAASEEQISDTAFTGSDLLGGSMGLADLGSPTIPARSLAARARAIRIGDPFSPLPSSYRLPMRAAMGELQKQTGPRRIEPARLVHLPSRLISKPVSVPVVLQSDGSVDLLNNPEDQRVVEDIRQWSSRQALPGNGTVEPAVVVVQPLPTVTSPRQAGASTQQAWTNRSLAPVPQAPAQPQPATTAAAQPTTVSDKPAPAVPAVTPVAEFASTTP